MCGLVALFSSQKPLSAEALERAIRRLGHRGPDASQTWLAPDGRAGLGHARLSIIDLTTGDQPIANEDASIRIIVNGEFYDFERIRSELEDRGHHFRTKADSEIALHLYEEFGTQALHHLRGEFAFVIWDEPNKLMFAARDRFGIKPLFYSMHNGVLHIASEAKALFAAGVPARWDRETFFQQTFFYADQDRTLFNGVYQIPPGHFLLATGQHVRVTRYWDMDYPVGDSCTRIADSRESIEILREKIEEAVRVRLRADVPVSCFLSGGIDSASVLGFAARNCSSPVEAFTVTFGQEGYDERDVAEETAILTGSRFHTVPVSQSDMADHLAGAVMHAETTGINWHGVARYLLSKAVRDAGYKVALSGEGSDELFAGYVQFRQDMAISENEISSSNVVKTPALQMPDESLENLSTPSRHVKRLLGHTPFWLDKVAINRAAFHLLLAEDFIKEFSDRDPFKVFMAQFDIRGQLEGRERLKQSLYLWSKSILPNYTLFAERLEMAHGVETRLPFLDHHVFEYVRQMPACLLIHGTREKYALREAVRPVVTETVYSRGKQPFLAPPLSFSYGNPLYELVQDTLRGSSLASVPFFNQRAVIEILDLLPFMDERKRIALDSTLLMIVSASLLHSSFHL